MGTFLRNCWYVAALAEEVTASAPFGRVICGEPIVLFRKQGNRVVAFEDRCCHRNYPLRHGCIEEQGLRCGYHGFVFNDAGQCIEIPGQTQIPPAARVRTYACVERYNWIWIWMGESSEADPADIPDYHWFDTPEWRASQRACFHVRANYRLIIENLLDLTHLTYVHSSTIGNSAVVDKAKVNFERSDKEVRVTRWMVDVPPPPAYQLARPVEGNVDRWQIIHYMPPGYCRLSVGVCRTGTGAPEGRRVDPMDWRNLNAITPETATTSHYFWGQAHNHDLDRPDVTEKIFGQVKTAFLEDIAVFEAQQRNLELFPDRGEVSVLADGGALHARRILDRLLKEQAEGKPARVSPRETVWGP